MNIVKDLGWLNIKQRRDYFVVLLVFKSLNNLLPDYITDKFTMTSEIDPLQTKNYFCQKPTKLFTHLHLSTADL